MRLRNYSYYAVQDGSFVWFRNVTRTPVYLIEIDKDGHEVQTLLQQEPCDCRSLELGSSLRLMVT